jgi:hypothetical protein
MKLLQIGEERYARFRGSEHIPNLAYLKILSITYLTEEGVKIESNQKNNLYQNSLIDG